MTDLRAEIDRVLTEGSGANRDQLEAELEEQWQTVAGRKAKASREDAPLAPGAENASEFLECLRKQIEAKHGGPNPPAPAPTLEPVPEIRDRPEPMRQEQFIPPTREENERYWREYWHPRPILRSETAYGKIYELNQNWVFPYVQVHRDFVDLLQLFYDLLPLNKAGKMSTSAINRVTNNILVTLNGVTTLDRDVLDRYRGRHYLVFSKTYSPADKTNDARKLLAKVRKESDYYRDHSSAKQIDALAHAMKKALMRPDEASRLKALKALPNRIHIDTRSKLGRPKFLYELPLDPPQFSIAYIEKDFDHWTLRIRETQEGIDPRSASGAR
jgi:hypothetical protein